MNTALHPPPTLPTAPTAADGLGEALRRLRAARTDAAWPALLAAMARDLMAASHAALFADTPEATAPEDWTPAPDWLAAARMALMAPVAAPNEAGVVLLAAPLPLPRRAPAILAVAIPARSALQVALARERLQMLAALATAEAEAAEAGRLGLTAIAGQAAAALLDAEHPEDGLHAAAARLALGLNLPRVALGLARGGQIRLFGDSASREIAKGSDHARRIAAALADGLDLTKPIAATTPTEAPPGVAQLLSHHEARAVALAPVPERHGHAATLLLDAPGLADPEGLAGALANAIGPALRQRAAALGRDRRAATGHRARRLAPAILGGLAVLVAALALTPWPDRVEAPFVIEAQTRRTVTAPFDGLLAASDIEPGAVVAAGTVLAQLSTREAELELAAAQAKARSGRMEAEVARAKGAPANEQVALLAAQRDEAQAALLAEHIRLATITAPTDGVVLSGDLRRQIGQAVQRGQTLFDIAARQGELEVDVLVPDARVVDIAPGQTGQLAPAAFPGRTIGFTVLRVAPAAEVVQGRNIFRIRGRPDITDLATMPARPGMEGMARINVGSTSLLDLLLREPVRIVRSWLWI